MGPSKLTKICRPIVNFRDHAKSADHTALGRRGPPARVPEPLAILPAKLLLPTEVCVGILDRKGEMLLHSRAFPFVYGTGEGSISRPRVLGSKSSPIMLSL